MLTKTLMVSPYLEGEDDSDAEAGDQAGPDKHKYQVDSSDSNSNADAGWDLSDEEEDGDKGTPLNYVQRKELHEFLSDRLEDTHGPGVPVGVLVCAKRLVHAYLASHQVPLGRVLLVGLAALSVVASVAGLDEEEVYPGVRSRISLNDEDQAEWCEGCTVRDFNLLRIALLEHVDYQPCPELYSESS